MVSYGSYSYSQPSSSEASLDYGSEGEFGRFPEITGPELYATPTPPEKAGPGIPDSCFCGLAPITRTSTTVKNPGRVFFGCKNSMDGGHHLFKWLDEALIDEIKEIRAASTTQLEFMGRMKDLDSYHQDLADIEHLACLLAEVKALLVHNRSALTMVKRIKEWKYLLVAGSIITIVVFYIFC